MEFDLSNAIAVLERTPRVLRSMLSGLPTAWTESNEGPETWSAYDIVGHLIHGDRSDWIVRAQLILDQGENRTFEPFDRFAQFRESEGKTIEKLLDEFEMVRAENLGTLKGWHLSQSHLALEGVHPSFGAVTLRQLLATWVAHDLAHSAQIARVMAKQLRDEIGPWREYMPIMDR
jgi:hypothetical protein